MHDIAKMERESREIFISERTHVETQFNNWKNAMRQTSDAFKQQVPFDFENWTLQSLIPEWYKDKPDRDVANQELAEANAKFKVINDLADNFNTKAVELYREFLKLYKEG